MWLELFLGRPKFNSSITLVNSQLVCLLPVGSFNHVMFIWIICFIIWLWYYDKLALKSPIAGMVIFIKVFDLQWYTTKIASFLSKPF